MPFADLPNARIHYAFSGPSSSGTLILCTSLGTDFSLWGPQTPAFEKQFRLLRYDMRGHGKSSVPKPPYSVAGDLVPDLLALADSLSIDRFHLCGLSVGGMIGMALALQAPQRLHKMVLTNTAAKIGTLESWNTRIETVRSKGMKEVVPITRDRWFTKQFQSTSPEAVAKTMRVVESLDPEGYVGGCCAVRDFDFRGQLSAIRIPTLVISGTHDPAATTADGRFLAEQIPGARYLELNASHLSNIEAADGYTSAVLGFLA
jgi:3-oxoadipate enol-lactonase